MLPGTPQRLLDPATRFFTFSFYAWFVVAFLLAEILGKTFAYGVESISILWPPTGVLGAALVILHRRHWIPIIILAIATDLSVSGIGIAQGLLSNTLVLDSATISLKVVGYITTPLAPLIFATTIRVLIPNGRPLSSPKAFGIYVLFPIGLNTAIVSFVVMGLNGLVSKDFPVLAGWQQWWYADITGFLAFATPIIVIAANSDQMLKLRTRSTEAIIAMLAFTLITTLLFTDILDKTYFLYYKFVLMLPIYAWIISRFGSVVMSLTALILTLVVLTGLVNNASPFDTPNRSAADNALVVQGFLVPVILAVLFIAALLESRRTQFEELLNHERQLRKLSNIESLGTMAGGVAHDFGNLAIAMRAYHTVLRKEINQPNKSVIDAINGLEEAADGAQTLTKSLMAMARDEHPDNHNHSESNDLCAVVKETIDALNPLITRNFPVITHIPHHPILIAARKPDIQRIVSNLVFNAKDASQAGDSIEVTIKQHPNGVWLLITDHGSGMSTQIQDHALDPFFTTKPRGQGTGLGLAIVAGIVRDIGATINIASEPGQGTTIAIDFPIATPDS